jgi:glucose-6-phosphate dehydrogenase assembly protein OpcA
MICSRATGVPGVGFDNSRPTIMTATAAQFLTGLPVEVGNINRELKKLWEQGGESMTRATLINLAVYSEAPDSLHANTQLIAKVAEEHACRAIVIAADPDAHEDRVEAWIAAHCHVSRTGSKQVCTEQISLAVAGSRANLPNIVFSHLDTDLPFYLWWQGEFREPMDAQLWPWVDRVIYDSCEWNDFAEQLRLLEVGREAANGRTVLCDLNWTRLLQFRRAVAQCFDPPAGDVLLGTMQRIEIAYAPAHRSTALLLVGWFAAQLGWTLVEAADDETLGFCDCVGEGVRVSLAEAAGEPIAECALVCGNTEIRITQQAGADLLDVSAQSNGRERMHQLMPAMRNEPAVLLSEELMRSGKRRVYLRALEAMRELL